MNTGQSAQKTRQRGRPPQPSAALLGAVAVAAGVIAAAGGASPTGLAALDWLLTAAAAAAVSAAGANARRWVFPVLCGPLLVAAQWASAAVAVAAWPVFALAMVTALRRRRSPLLGSISAGAGAALAGWLPSFGFLGAPTILAVLCCLPVLISGLRVARRRTRRRVRIATISVAGAVLVLTVLAGVATLIARPAAQDAADHARAGLAAARSGDADEASARLRAASDEFSSASSILGWATPARVLPVMSQQLDALGTLTDSGAALAERAAEAAETADVRSVAIQEGQLDLATLAAMEGPVVSARDDLYGALERIDRADSPWLVAPLATELADFGEEVAAAATDARLAATGAALAPALFGGDEPRRYFVAAINTAEARAGGGIIGNFVEITAVDGDLEKTESGRPGADLNPGGDPDSRVLEAPEDYMARYGERGVERYWQDLTLSPDFPSVAAAIGSLYPQSGGAEIDGVISMDSYAVAAFLELTGPIQVADLDEPLDADNAAEFLLHEQYVQFPDRSERTDFLEDLTEAIFDEITNGSLPSAARIGDVLGPMVEQGRLRLHSFHPAEQEFIEALGLDGSFPAPDSDTFALITQNGSHSKIDWFAHRRLSYDIALDPATGRAEATATAVLANEAPASGLPTYILGGNQAPAGVNRTLVSLYSPLSLEGATVEGERLLMTSERELGHNVYSGYVEVPPGQELTVEFQLTGEIAIERNDDGELLYELDVFRQPTVHPDEMAFTLELAPGWTTRELLADGEEAGSGRVLDLAWTLDKGVGIEARIARVDQ